MHIGHARNRWEVFGKKVKFDGRLTYYDGSVSKT
jgi:hypothetical protein